MENPRFKYIEVQWQLGLPSETGTNGCYIEDVIEYCMAKLNEMNSKVPCVENRFAITKLNEALQALKYREGDRRSRGVIGTLDH